MSTDDLSVQSTHGEPATVLEVSGVLDSDTYLHVRDAIVQAASSTPGCLVIDIRALTVPAPSAWKVLTSAAWLIRRWPAVPMAVVADPARRAELDNEKITRSVPAYDSLDTALNRLAESQDDKVTRRIHTTIRRDIGSPIAAARAAVADAVGKWDRDFVSLALVLTTVLVRNALVHTSADPEIAIEVRGSDQLFVAVSDDSSDVPARVEDEHGHTRAASGLAVLTTLSRQWSYTPRGTGKTVWAVIGPEEVARFTNPEREV